MFVKLMLFALVLHMREMSFQDDFGEEQMEENTQRPFRRRISQFSACIAKPKKCAGTCFYEFIDRGCSDADASKPRKNIAGLGKSDADSEKYPFMLSLRRPREYSNGTVVPDCFTHFCGAVLLWKDIAITAAHCLVNDQRPLLTDDKPFSKFNSKITVSRFSQCRHQDGSEELFAQEAIVHPEYNKRYYNNDIAIIRLRGEMSTDYGFIKLYTSKNDENIFDAQILGFGATILDKEFSTESTNLQLATVETVVFDTCKKLFESIDEPESANTLNSTTMLCSRAFDADTCEGDSGGPLFLEESDGQVYLLGIDSWGAAQQCKVMNFGQPPSVFARINFYKDWIVETVNQLTFYPPYQIPQDNQDDAVSTTALSLIPDIAPTPQLDDAVSTTALSLIPDIAPTPNFAQVGSAFGEYIERPTLGEVNVRHSASTESVVYDTVSKGDLLQLICGTTGEVINGNKYWVGVGYDTDGSLLYVSDHFIDCESTVCQKKYSLPTC